jgi:hypothetical protein
LPSHRLFRAGTLHAPHVDAPQDERDNLGKARAAAFANIGEAMRKFEFLSSASRLSLVAFLAVAVALGCTSAGPSPSGNGQQQAASASTSDETTHGDVASADEATSRDEAPATNDEPAEAAIATAATDAAPQVEPENAAVETTAVAAVDAQPVAREAAKPVVESYAAGVPPVLLSAGHAALCKVMVGDVLPAIELPALDDGASVQLASLAGKQVTIIVFWTADRWMSESVLHDLAAMKWSEGVAVVGIATKIDKDAAGNVLAKAGAKFPHLLDADGAALASVGQDSLPRIYVLDAESRIAWFDLEYSEATRRELAQTVAALTK